MSELDPALARLQETALEYGGGLANHGPMAAEALETLGHEALVPAFVDVYLPRLPERDEGRVIPVAERIPALGNGADADWVATFLEVVEGEPWRAALRRWLPELLPGLFAAATHGVLRTAHGVRAAERHETPPRVREVAFGLAYWASRFHPLPGVPGAEPEPGHGPAALLAALAPVPDVERADGFFDAAVRVLDDRADFAASMARLDLASAPPGDLVSELCATAAGLYLAHPERRIAYAHCVTAPSALRLLAPHLADDALRTAVGHGVQAVAALHATQSLRPLDDAPTPDPEVVRLAAEPAEIRYRAACSAEEHAIKLAEACLREDAIRPDPRLRLAAADAAVAIGVSAGARGA